MSAIFLVGASALIEPALHSRRTDRRFFEPRGSGGQFLLERGQIDRDKMPDQHSFLRELEKICNRMCWTVAKLHIDGAQPVNHDRLRGYRDSRVDHLVELLANANPG